MICSNLIFHSYRLLTLLLDLTVECITHGNKRLRLNLEDCLVQKAFIFLNQKVYLFEKQDKLVDGAVNEDQLLHGPLLIFFIDILKDIKAAVLILLVRLPCL